MLFLYLNSVKRKKERKRETVSGLKMRDSVGLKRWYDDRCGALHDQTSN